MALFHRQFIYAAFTPALYKRMLGKTLLDMDDLEAIDLAFYNSLVYIRNNDLDGLGDLYFEAQYQLLGNLKCVELIPGGSQILVTEENKENYVRMMADWRLSRPDGTEKRTAAFLEGFKEVVPFEWLDGFDERELELMLCGTPDIDVDDWERHTIYSGGYWRHSIQVEWFWHFVRTSDAVQRALILQFVCGTSKVPVGGFAELRGIAGLGQRFCIARGGSSRMLPYSHTCGNQLDLPTYKSYDQLVDRMTLAIRETQGFGLK